MKASVIALFTTIAAVMAAPASSIEERQLGTTSNELKQGDCKPVTFIMVRGSTETGNMVSSSPTAHLIYIPIEPNTDTFRSEQGEIPGPPTCSGLKQAMGAANVACQGVGAEDGYAAALAPNFQPKNTDDQSIAAATKIMNMAMTKCPQSTIVMAGYSQGSAVVDNAIQAMPAASQQKIAGVVLFGYTRNAQDKAQIPGYPKAQTKIFCATGDLVCDNTLTITAAHLSYAANAPEASKFLATMAQAGAGAAGGAAGATGATAATAATKATKAKAAKGQ